MHVISARINPSYSIIGLLQCLCTPKIQVFVKRTVIGLWLGMATGYKGGPSNKCNPIFSKKVGESVICNSRTAPGKTIRVWLVVASPESKATHTFINISNLVMRKLWIVARLYVRLTQLRWLEMQSHYMRLVGLYSLRRTRTIFKRI